MQTTTFGRTGRPTSRIGFGAWAIGGTWGEVTVEEAKATLHAALDAGMTFVDTADVYGDGRSERIIRDVLAERPGERPFVATKAGRRLSPHVAEGYTQANIEAFIDRSLTNLGIEMLDLVQLHCPPTPVYSDPGIYAALDAIKAKGKIADYGVSVETVDEAREAIRHPGVVSVQIIYNLFRQKPAEVFFKEALARNVAVIARVPLASGLLTGKMSAASTFAADDHRSFNRNGEAFDKGETFSGVPFDVALAAVEELRPLVPQGATMAAFALRWILMEDAVTVVIPGAKSPAQARANAADLPALSVETMDAAREVYRRHIAPHVHHLW
ncbi:MAG: aldo/keto reductase [Tabrizicola sp.]|uniref:aldo/keto reductase n=1 Tax=Tabrizicola sp. TaxID=2005166 RepID=UPI0027327B27|nr:aldo/keto reductase [Tabrizicola sp.]MDP3265006.1 aldo/keto reductase [Tabrizicola sp.]MDP3647451.1 aldo/keto reductase [Paracoccaceae bacterium]MDZ4068678.1 aldo/keto reductase [Tabrizicola sp.]